MSSDKTVHLDETIWPSRVNRIIPKELQAKESKIAPIDDAKGWMKYRGIYYYSTNTKYPYIKLRRHSALPCALPICCSLNSYQKFIKLLDDGFFPELNVKIHTNNIGSWPTGNVINV